MQTRKLGKGGPAISAIGLGCMGMTGGYGPATRPEALATIDAALDAGINLLDTGDFYGLGENELLLRDALRGRRDKFFVAVKFGAQRAPDGTFIGFDARPAAVKAALGYSLHRLGTDYVDLYQPARLDPAVPIEETVGAIAEMVKAGYVRHIGLSEVAAATIRRAQAIHPIAALQIEYSLMSRSIEQQILPTVRELGISVTAYGVLSRGLLNGEWNAGMAPAAGDLRGHFPRFAGDNLTRNLALVEALRSIARHKDATPAQVAIAWVASRGADIIPLIGARKPEHLTSAVAALNLKLSPSDIDAIETAVPAAAVAGGRYGQQQMAMLDSERAEAAGR